MESESKAFRFAYQAINYAKEIAKECGGYIELSEYPMDTKEAYPEGMEDERCMGEFQCVDVIDNDYNHACRVGWRDEVDEDDVAEYDSLRKALKEDRCYLVKGEDGRYHWGVDYNSTDSCSGADDYMTLEKAKQVIEEFVDFGYDKDFFDIETRPVETMLDLINYRATDIKDLING